MENTESELQHNDVRKEDFFSETYYFNGVEFYKEFDKLILEYDFLLDIDNYREDIPKNAADRYNIFKDSVARYYFLHYLQEYKDLTMRSEIKSVVIALHQEYLQMDNNPKLKETHSDYYPIYLKATRFIKEFVDKGNDVILSYSKEDVETMLYLLHRENYFKDFPIPDDAFDVNSYSNPYSIIAEVYAKYFLFTEFIKDVYNKLSPVEGGNGTTPFLRQTEPINIPEHAVINNENRLVAVLIHPTFKSKYDKILRILSEKNPLGKVVSNLPVAKRNELLSLKNELKIFQNKLVYRVEDEKVFVDKKYKRLKTFLVYLFAYMITMKWMDRAENYETTCQIIANTMFYKDGENDKILLDRAQLNAAVKKLEATGQTDEFNSYLKFINLIVSNV
jgi:hypothetical protein